MRRRGPAVRTPQVHDRVRADQDVRGDSEAHWVDPLAKQTVSGGATPD